ncbi:alpha/beta hydrolase fold domain-containing protein [Actinopolyspora mzabensis]
MVIGDRFVGLETVLDRVEEPDAVALSVEYRLVPEYPAPATIEDCYPGLVWTASGEPRSSRSTVRSVRW